MFESITTFGNHLLYWLMVISLVKYIFFVETNKK